MYTLKPRWAANGIYNSSVMQGLRVQHWGSLTPPFKLKNVYSWRRTRLQLLSIIGLLMVLIGLQLSTLASASAETQVYVFVAEDSCLNMHTNAKVHSDVLVRYFRGDIMSLDTVDKYGWARVSRYGDWGYCRIEYLSDSTPGDPVMYRTIKRNVRARELPNTEASTTAKLKKGVDVSVVLQITVDGIVWAKRAEGDYIQLKYLQCTSMDLTVEED